MPMMELIWSGFFGLLAISLVRRHGWEYVPLLVLLVAGRWYAGRIGYGTVAEAPTLAAVAGIWFVAKTTRERA